MKRTLTVIILFATAAALCPAASTTLTRSDAHLLYLALNNVQSGLSPQNVAIAADDINVLEPIEHSLNAAQLAYNRRVVQLRHKADAEAKLEAVSDDFLAAQETKVTVELTPLELTADELTAAKPPPAVLAPIRRLLGPPQPRK